jgi:hypothetical protein
VGAVFAFILGIVLYTHGKPGEETQVRLFIVLFVSGIVPVADLIVTTLLGLYVVQIARVTRDEIVSMPLLAKWFPKLAWLVPVQSVNEASVVEYAAVAERLERDGAGQGARITYFEEKGKKTDKSFLNAAIVDGEGIPLRVRRFRREMQGALLVLNDGGSVFLGFNNPAEAVTAIHQARGGAV